MDFYRSFRISAGLFMSRSPDSPPPPTHGTLLVSHSDTLNIDSPEFPFHTPKRRRAGGGEVRGAWRTRRRPEEESVKGHGRGGINTPGAPRRRTHEQRWRESCESKERSSPGTARRGRTPSSGDCCNISGRAGVIA